MKYIQVPVNVMMPEAFIEPWQEYSQEEKGNVIKAQKILVAACNLLEINLITSQPLFQGKLVELPLPNKMGVFNQGSRHLQFIRSIPSRCVQSTLVGMKDSRHVNYNLEVVRKEPMAIDDWMDVMKPSKRAEYVETEAD